MPSRTSDRDTFAAAARRAASGARHLHDGRRSRPAAIGRDPAGARPRRRRRARGRRAVFRSAGRRPGDPARHRARAGGGRQPARVARADRGGPAAASRRRSSSSATRTRCCGWAWTEFARQAAGGRRGRRAGARPADRRSRRVSRDAGGGRHRHDLSSEPDDDRRADPEGGGARAAGSCTAFRGWASPARAHRSRPAPTRWCGASARTRRCRSRSASASRGRSTSPKSARYADAAVVGSALVSLIAEAARVAGPDRARRRLRPLAEGAPASRSGATHADA